MCNRVGTEDEMEFSGESIVTDFNGNIRAVADYKEQLLITEVDLGAATRTREAKSYVQLRRPNLYE
jgi:predicted amidohydrolase